VPAQRQFLSDIDRVKWRHISMVAIRSPFCSKMTKGFLKCFLTETAVLVDWKCWSKNWQHRNCVDSARSTDRYPTRWATVGLPVCCQFFDQRFQSTKTSVFVRKHFKQSPCSIFLIFWQRFGQVLIFSVHSRHWHIGINWRHNYVINSKEYITKRWNIFTRLWSVFIQL